LEAGSNADESGVEGSDVGSWEAGSNGVDESDEQGAMLMGTVLKTVGKQEAMLMRTEMRTVMRTVGMQKAMWMRTVVRTVVRTVGKQEALLMRTVMRTVGKQEVMWMST
jgi:hypothetical protein